MNHSSNLLGSLGGIIQHNTIQYTNRINIFLTKKIEGFILQYSIHTKKQQDE